MFEFFFFFLRMNDTHFGVKDYNTYQKLLIKVFVVDFIKI